jgi:hypothetical protein
MKMGRPFSSLRKDASGSAAFEMALVTPILVTLMFGSFELGYYYLSEHALQKAVRDGARFASRQSFANMPCGAGALATNVAGPAQKTDLITRYGNIAGTGIPRLPGWTSSVAVTMSCGAAATYSGIYKGMESAVPIVTVSATVRYSSLFKRVGFPSVGLNLTAESQAAVMGI